MIYTKRILFLLLNIFLSSTCYSVYAQDDVLTENPGYYFPLSGSYYGSDPYDETSNINMADKAFDGNVNTTFVGGREVNKWVTNPNGIPWSAAVDFGEGTFVNKVEIYFDASYSDGGGNTFDPTWLENAEIQVSTSRDFSTDTKVLKVINGAVGDTWYSYDILLDGAIPLDKKYRYLRFFDDDVKTFMGAELPIPVFISEIKVFGVKESHNDPPEVTLSPIDDKYIVETPITLTATATDDIGIEKIEFLANDIVVGTSTTSPYQFIWTPTVLGSYEIKARAYDLKSVTSDSNIESVNIVENEAPLTTLLLPVIIDNIEPGNVKLSATATDSDGTIQYVEFYANDISIGRGVLSSGVYKLNSWIPGSSGNYSMVAKSVDDRGKVGVSESQNVAIMVNNAPETILTANIYQETSPGVVNLTATATDPNNDDIKNITFYKDGIELFVDNSAPYEHDISNLLAGEYVMSAKATDIRGKQGPESVANVTILGNNPVVDNLILDLIEPIVPGKVKISATVSDLDGNNTIQKVSFDLGNGTIIDDTTYPYEYEWSDIAVGEHMVTVIAYDNTGLSSNAEMQTFVISELGAPEVEILPAEVIGSAPATVILKATAIDDSSIELVEFYMGSTLLGSTETEQEGIYSIQLEDISAGTYIVYAIATDDQGNKGYSLGIEVVVNVASNILPVIELLDPIISGAAPATVSLMANASDQDGQIEQVEFFNGSTSLFIDIEPPYEYDWLSVSAGTYIITATATDNSGAVVTSNEQSVTISEASVGPQIYLQPPVVSGSSPTASISLLATVTDVDGVVQKVLFYKNGTPIFEDIEAPYEYTVTNVSSGNYTFIASAIDINEDEFYSNEQVVSIGGPNKPPVVKMLPPVVSSNAPADVYLEAEATDENGTIKYVRFLYYKTSSSYEILKEDNSYPYTCVVENVPAGRYNIIARAVDNQDAVVSSNKVVVVVDNPKDGYFANLVVDKSIRNDYKYLQTESIKMTANVGPSEEEYSKVEFWNGNKLLVTDSSAPFSFELKNMALGTYYLYAKAYQVDGSYTAISNNEIVKVISPLPTNVVCGEVPYYTDTTTYFINDIVLYGSETFRCETDNLQGVMPSSESIHWTKISDCEQTDKLDLIKIVYPNPSTESLYVKVDIETGTDYSIDIISIQGFRIVYSKKLKSVSANGEHVELIDISGFETGNYIVLVKNGSISDNTTILKK